MISRINPQGTRILVVDDRESTRYGTVRVLRAAGAEVAEAENGAQALLAGSRADLIVLDINLPDMDGFEVCRRLRDSVETRDTPLIHLSAAYLSDQHKIDGLRSGADAYLTHPSDPEMLIATVNTLLRARRAEEASRQHAQLLQTIFSAARVGIAVLAEDLRIIEANPAFCALAGVAEAAVSGLALPALLRAETQAASLMGLAAGQGGGLLRGIATDTVCEYTVSPVGEQRWLLVLMDVSARLAFEKERESLLAAERTSRAEAERANAMKDDFLAVLSHELRNPLNNVLGWANILKRDASQHLRQEAAAAIERNVHIQVGLVEDLLDVSRIAAGKVHLELRQLDARQVIGEAAGALLPAAAEAKIQLDISLPGPLWIEADATRLTQICTNLVSNAIKFTRPGGAVQLRLEDEDEAALLVVQDNGIGIAADFLPHIFDRFRQADASTTRRAGGLGLGLAIVSSLVELHGGSVVAHSEGTGRGARFEVRLPKRHAGSAPPPPGAAALPVDKPLLAQCIMVVDDSSEARRVLAFALEDWGAEVIAFDNGPDALRSLAERLPALLISDVSMPDMDGYQLIRAVRAGHPAGRLPALALTAFARDEDIERVKAAGFQGHVAKPVDIDVLLASVLAVLLRNSTAPVA